MAGLQGFTGRGIGVAIIDSGVAEHSSLRGRVVARLISRRRRARPSIRFGHGTHVAGIVGGVDSDGEYSGIAPAPTWSA